MRNARLMIFPAVAAAMMLGGTVGSLVPTTMRMAEKPEWMKLPERQAAATRVTYRFVESAPVDLSPELARDSRLYPEIDGEFPMLVQRRVERTGGPVAYVPVHHGTDDRPAEADDEVSPALAAAAPIRSVNVHRPTSDETPVRVSAAAEAAPSLMKSGLATKIY